MLDIKLIGNRIRELRKECGITQNAFADALHVSFQAVSNWERGIAPPELENLINISSFFGVLVDDLLRPYHDRLFLGIDGGGTKTEFAVVSEDGTVLERFCKEGSNPNDKGFQNAFDVICDGIREALIKFPHIASVFCGVAGVSVGNTCGRMENLLTEKYPSIRFSVKTDSSNLFGMDDSSDLAVISGTGSVVFVRDGEKYIRLGGWGYLFDSEGSAYDIGRDAISAALAFEDGIGKTTRLSSLLQKELDTSCVFNAISKLHSGGKAYIASFAPLVFKAHLDGDSVASEILDKNMERLGKLLDFGANHYGVRKKAIAGGGIFEHYSDIVLPMLKKHTDVEIIPCTLPPIYGACRQSVKLTNIEITQDFMKNFENTYGGAKK